MGKYSEFLHDVENLSEKYASIYINCELEPLVMPFWSWQKIQQGLSLRAEWEVADTLIPFYGDWHDLFCLNEKTGEIVALNDNRETVCRWASVNEFISSLSINELVYDIHPQLTAEAYSPDTADNSNGLKKKH